MSVESTGSAQVAARGTLGWVLTGIALYVPLVYAAMQVGVAPAEAVLELTLPVVAILWGGRDLLRAPWFGPAPLMTGLLLLIAGSFEVSGILTGWPNANGHLADLFLIAGMLGSVLIESRRRGH